MRTQLPTASSATTCASPTSDAPPAAYAVSLPLQAPSAALPDSADRPALRAAVPFACCTLPPRFITPRRFSSTRCRSHCAVVVIVYGLTRRSSRLSRRVQAGVGARVGSRGGNERSKVDPPPTTGRIEPRQTLDRTPGDPVLIPQRAPPFFSLQLPPDPPPCRLPPVQSVFATALAQARLWQATLDPTNAPTFRARRIQVLRRTRCLNQRVLL